MTGPDGRRTGASLPCDPCLSRRFHRTNTACLRFKDHGLHPQKAEPIHKVNRGALPSKLITYQTVTARCGLGWSRYQGNLLKSFKIFREISLNLSRYFKNLKSFKMGSTPAPHLHAHVPPLVPRRSRRGFRVRVLVHGRAWCRVQG